MHKQAASMGRLVAVVVTHDRLDKLRLTLRRLLETPPAQLEAVLVVDNASQDGTGAWLATQDDPRLAVHRCASNCGGAGGFEIGMRLAMERFDPDWLVVMDDDSRPTPGTLETFQAADRSTAEAWAAAVYLPGPDKQICDMNRPAVNPFWHRRILWRTLLGRGRDGFHLGPADYAPDAGPRAVDSASFVGLFISRAAVARAGYPDGQLFIYGDDTLYTLTLSRAGGRILFDPSLVFEHDFSTHSETDKRFRPLWKSYYHYRNLLMVYRLCSGRLFVLVAPAAALKWLLKVRHHSGERRAFLGYVTRALRDGILRRTDVSHDTVKGWRNGRG
ncbi:glycosyltransferase [Lutimaribacter sp. EGI FJ00015]|uniref:Glycosyltransferase n=1 Tax=Lutimaribacter degradans TaxID=2945989 RepID=A0ACC5ZZT9_9RHOB|nr:glycosyltransferase [Lutimaribacter sp. EGI FJ00013]MCM2563861.1 glycosyltransferase [Lutimaribacter sp. EGI FJ00013]MCO0615040.1 glycosyltransferase [Lutimaribacter sp. EGI FJ00015]MCO0637712.1 glycosyltransferase [Lutimaribacter sp. EGI FJ00014]